MTLMTFGRTKGGTDGDVLGKESAPASWLDWKLSVYFIILLVLR